MNLSRSLPGFAIVGVITWMVAKPYINDFGRYWPESAPILYWVIGIGIIAGVVTIGWGTWKLSQDKNAVITKHFATGFWALLIAIAIGAMVFGPAAIERIRDDLRTAGDNFANRIEGSNSSSDSARDLLCGPGKYQEKHLTSVTIPIRLERVFPCKPTLALSKDMAVRVRYNGKGPYRLWAQGVAKAPEAYGTVDFVEVLLAKSHPMGVTVKIKYN